MNDNSVVSPTATGQVAEETTEKTPVVDSGTTEKAPLEGTQKEKTFSRSEVNKMMNAEREKIKAELLQEYESKKSEAEKLAKMDAEQKLNYELEQKTKEVESLKSELHSHQLREKANAYATEKGLPLGYIEDLDFSRETAESVKEKIDKITKTRSNDLEGYLKDKLKQNPPKEVNDSKESTDPYIQGFKNYMKNNNKK